jgi:hypothetical protein
MSNFTKFILLLLIGLVIAFCCLWLIGGKKVEYETTLTIDANPDMVAAYITDSKLISRWRSDIVDDGAASQQPFEKGRTSRVAIRTKSGEVEADEEVLISENKPEKKNFSVRLTSPDQVATSIYELTLVENNKTRLVYKIKATPVGFARIRAIFEDDNIKSHMETDAQKLREIAEQASATQAAQSSSGQPSDNQASDDQSSDDQASENQPTDNSGGDQ